MQETHRKTARTFAAQLRLLEQYPEYRYIQSQPAAYEMCREHYPEPVSYTHLDVYKRQPQDKALEAEIFRSASVKRCAECGAAFVPRSNRCLLYTSRCV